MAVPVPRRRSIPSFDPFTDVQRTLDEFFGEWPGPRLASGMADFWVPVADIEELDDAWVVELEVPGVGKDDIEVEVHGRQLSVTGERKEKERAGVLRRRARVTGRFEYAVTLGTDIDPDGIVASLDDGVLVVRVPKHAADQPRKISIR
jgi:HSP20 family protein